MAENPTVTYSLCIEQLNISVNGSDCCLDEEWEQLLSIYIKIRVSLKGHFVELILLSFKNSEVAETSIPSPSVFGKALQAAPGMGKVRGLHGLLCDFSVPAGDLVDSEHFTWWCMHFLESGRHRRTAQHSLRNLNLSDSLSRTPVIFSKAWL